MISATVNIFVSLLNTLPRRPLILGIRQNSVCFLIVLQAGYSGEADSMQGLMCSYWVGLAFYYTNGQIAWRFPVTFQCVFTFAM